METTTTTKQKQSLDQLCYTGILPQSGTKTDLKINKNNNKKRITKTKTNKQKCVNKFKVMDTILTINYLPIDYVSKRTRKITQ